MALAMIPAGYSRASFSGHLPGGEIFGWSLWTSEAPTDQAATQAQADAYAAAFASAMAVSPNVLTLLGTGSGYDTVRVYSYLDTSGKATHIAQSANSHPGTGTTSFHPNQCALVVSLLTDNAGRRNRGRIYLPINAIALDAGGQLDSGHVINISNNLAALIHDLNVAADPGKIVVLSQAGASSTPVTSVRVDSRIDTQRRRAKSQTVEFSMTTTVV